MKRRTVSGYDQFTFDSQLNLASHSYRAAIIGALLAEAEGSDIGRVVVMLLFHENGEVRTGDPDMVAAKYGMKENDCERRAFKDQIRGLPEKFKNTIYSLFKEKSKHITVEAKVAADADILEHIFTAKEKYDSGEKGAKIWLEDRYDFYTDSGREMFEELLKGDSLEWIKRLQ